MHYNWPTRDEWAKQRSTIYADQENPHRTSMRAEDYATDAEIAEARSELKDRGRSWAAI